MTRQLVRSFDVRAAAERLAARTRSPFAGIEMRTNLRRMKRRTRQAVDRAVTVIRRDRKAQAAVASVAVAAVAGLLAMKWRRH